MFSGIASLFNTLVFEPLVNLLVVVLHVVPGGSMGLAIIVVIFLVKLVLYLPSNHSLKTQQKLTVLRPELQKLAKQHKDDPQARMRAQSELYRAHGVNPFASLLFPIFVQLPIFFGLYRVFLTEFNGNGFTPYLYSFISEPSAVTMEFLGATLTEPFIPFAIAAGVAQYIQARSLAQQAPKNTATGKKGEPDFQASMNMSMMYIFPVLIGAWGMFLPSGLSLYWIVSSLFSYGQQYIIQRRTSERAEAASIEAPASK